MESLQAFIPIEIGPDEDILGPIDDFFTQVLQDKKQRLKDSKELHIPPEARHQKTSKDGIVEILFTQKMLWPEGLMD